MCTVSEFRRNWFSLTVNLIIGSAGYFIVSFSVKNVPTDIITTTISSSLSDIVSVLISGFIYSMLGPRKAFLFGYFLTIIGGGLLLLFWDSQSLLIQVYFFLYKNGMAQVLTMNYFAVVMLIPQAYSTSVFGLSHFFSSWLTALSPLIGELEFPTPILINIGLSVLAILGTLPMVEKLPKCI